MATFLSPTGANIAGTSQQSYYQNQLNNLYSNPQLFNVPVGTAQGGGMLATLLGGAANAAGSYLGSRIAGGGMNVNETLNNIAEIQSRAIQDASAQAQQYTQQAQGIITQGAQTARSDLAPYNQVGQAALQFYSNLMGLGGAEASQQAFDRYMSTGYAKVIDRNLGRSQQALERKFAGSGLLQSGNFAAAIQQLTREETEQGLIGFQNQLQPLIGQGLQAAGGMANISMNSSQNLANLEQQLGKIRSDQILGVAGAAAGALQGALGYEHGGGNQSYGGGLF